MKKVLFNSTNFWISLNSNTIVSLHYKKFEGMSACIFLKPDLCLVCIFLKSDLCLVCIFLMPNLWLVCIFLKPDLCLVSIFLKPDLCLVCRKPNLSLVCRKPIHFNDGVFRRKIFRFFDVFRGYRKESRT